MSLLAAGAILPFSTGGYDMKAYPGMIPGPGMSTENLIILQRAINEEAENAGLSERCEISGECDLMTQKCVAWFNDYYGLPAGNRAGYFLWNRLVNKC